MSAKLHATTVYCKEYRNEQKVYIYYAVDDHNEHQLILASCNGCNLMRYDSSICKSCKESCTKKFVEDWPILR